MKKNIFRSRLGSNVLSGMMAMTVSTAVSIVIAPLVLADVGSDQYGLWAVLSMILIVGRFGNQGLGDSVVRHIALANGKKDYKAVQSYFTTAFVIVGLVSIPCCILIGLFRNLFLELLAVPVPLFDLGRRLLSWLIVLLILFLGTVVVNATITGLGRIDLRNKTNIIARVLQLGVTVGFLKTGFGIWSVLIGQFVFQIVTLAFGFYYIRRIGKILLWNHGAVSFELGKEMTAMGMGMVTARIIQLGLDPLVRVMLSRYMGLDYVTAFDVGGKVTNALRAVANAGLQALAPYASAAEVKGKLGMRNMVNLNKRFVITIIGFGLPLFGLLFLLGGYIMQIWLGDSYDQRMLTCLRILIVPLFFNLCIMPFYHSLIGWGRSGLYVLISIAAVVVFLIGLGVNALYDFTLGMEGILGAYALSTFVGAATVMLAYRKVLKEQLA